MAVIIEGMEMPKGCRDCRLSHIINNDETYCNLTHHFVDQLVDRKDKDCPLREVKTGHWEQYGNSWEDKFKCSECGKEQPKILCCERIIGHWSDYCPNCGAKLQDGE